MFLSTLSRTALMLTVLALAAATGCQKENGADVKEKPAAGFQQVRVELTGLT